MLCDIYTFFFAEEILHQQFLRHKILLIYFGVCCFFVIKNKCTNICDATNCNAKKRCCKNKFTNTFVDSFLPQKILCKTFLRKKILGTNFLYIYF